MTAVEPRGTVPAAYVRDGRTIHVLPLPGKPPRELSLNGSHGHPRAVARVRRTLKAATLTRVRQSQLEEGCTHLLVELHYVPKVNRRRDADNLVPVLKPCLDALVQGKIVADDTPQHVTWRPPIIHPHDATCPRMWLEVTPLDAAPTTP